MYTAASGMMAQQMNMENIANNISNASTSGFTKTRVDFQELMYVQMENPGGGNSGSKVGLGVKGAGTQKVFGQENLEYTGNPFDLAINGEGFFQVQLPDGKKVYTRYGRFDYNSDTQEIITKQGYKLGIKIDDQKYSDVRILEDGKIMAIQKDNGEEKQVGQIKLAKFANPEGLRPVGASLYEYDPEKAGDMKLYDPGKGKTGFVKSGEIVKSNVNVIGEMMSLLQAQRSYEMAQKGVQSSDEMIRTAIQMKRGA
jgi:flagellar basal-body rod protein FlgG